MTAMARLAVLAAGAMTVAPAPLAQGPPATGSAQAPLVAVAGVKTIAPEAPAMTAAQAWVASRPAVESQTVRPALRRRLFSPIVLIWPAWAMCAVKFASTNAWPSWGCVPAARPMPGSRVAG